MKMRLSIATATMTIVGLLLPLGWMDRDGRGADNTVIGTTATDPLPPGITEADVQRTRKTVRMLDDIYKTAIVLITDKYVNDVDDFPAGSAAIEWFRQIQDKGWHELRLIDVSGEPYDADNVARDEFEKHAVKQLKAGKSMVEKVIVKQGKPYLRAATAVPVVMEKCTMCHPHYADVPEGQAIGAIVYTVPMQ